MRDHLFVLHRGVWGPILKIGAVSTSDTCTYGQNSCDECDFLTVLLPSSVLHRHVPRKQVYPSDHYLNLYGAMT